LWILRIATGWRIVFTSPRPSAQRTSTASAQAAPESQPEAPEATDGSVPASGSRQFRIEHILGAMAVIAIALGLARVAVIHETFPGGNVDAWTSLLVACAFCCIWSALSTLPCLWAAFSAPEKGAAAIAIGGYTVFMTLIAAAILGGGGFLEAAGMLLLFNGTLAAVMLGILHVARACGYALLRPGRPVQRPAPADPPDRNEIGKPSPPADPPPSL
jgi:Flp pilus assembly pilin Flp